MHKENKNDCYAKEERLLMEWWQKCREKTLSPILKKLHERNVSANHLTLASLMAGLAAAALLPFNIPAALFFLLLHVLADGLDGPLARYSNTASNRGSFTDTAADQIVIIANILALVYMNVVDPIAAVIYVIAYTLVVGFAIVRNALNIPYSWLVRPRFVTYLWLVVEFYIFPNTLNILIWLCNAFLAAKTITGFYKIRGKI